MVRQRLVIAFGCIALAAGVAIAEAPDDSKGRFAMTPVEGGFLRLDKETGSVSLCTRKAEHWMCDLVEDRTRTIDDKVARLETENQSLKERLRSLEDSLSTGKPTAKQPDVKIQIPSEEEVDKALDYVERMFKKFRERIGRIDKPLPPKTEGQGGSL
jgi:hypothetical protein